MSCTNNKPDDMNRGEPSSDPLCSLNDLSKEQILRGNGVLFGFTIDTNEGPVRSTRQVARCKNKDDHYPHLWIQEKQHLDTELIQTRSNRESNYVHQGWSLCAISDPQLWTSIRIQKKAQATRNHSWLTKCTVKKRLVLNIPLRDLEAAAEFEVEIQAALAKPDYVERFHAVYQALEFWGDVLPLVLEIGDSLVITDLEINVKQENYWLGQNFKVSDTARISMQGGNPKRMVDGVGGCPKKTWHVVRVLQTVPTTALLKPDIQERLADLYSGILSYNPLRLDEVAAGSGSWDNTSYALKTISQVVVRCGDILDSVSVSYTDNTPSIRHGGSGGSENVFTLSKYEYISDVVVWNNADSVCAVQFVTTAGRFSPHYGAHRGTPTILSSEGGVLAAVSGRWRTSDGKDFIHRIQTIWRHDIVQTPFIMSGKYSEYIGGTGGGVFNDWSFFGASYSAYISRIDVQCGHQIDGIQLTYCQNNGKETRTSQAPYHGGSGGGRGSFQLKPSEHIVVVSGIQNGGNIVRLRFSTNQGRTSDTFGGDRGTSFVCQPHTHDGKAMRLIFIAGKCGDLLDGLLFVWVPL